MSGKELYEQMSNYVNSFGHNGKDVAEAFSKDHRSLQADIIYLCMAIIREASDMFEDGDYDERNEDAFDMCNQIVERLYDKY